ncbi:hypothetical protein FB451DRAFT_1360633 [Mycena latifolia]|nr:hypothetical protein FB451DRAFT_1360633 [Mycena latifolia]
MRGLACQLLEKLARHKSTAGGVMDLKLCAQLVAILKFIQLFSDILIIMSISGGTPGFYALEVLGSVANRPNGAEAVVAAKALNPLIKSLGSRSASVRESACSLLAALAQHESTGQAVARAIPRERLVVLIRDGYFARESARKALQAIDDYLAQFCLVCRYELPDEPYDPLPQARFPPIKWETMLNLFSRFEFKFFCRTTWGPEHRCLISTYKCNIKGIVRISPGLDSPRPHHIGVFG